jgi:hypothetical protein
MDRWGNAFFDSSSLHLFLSDAHRLGTPVITSENRFVEHILYACHLMLLNSTQNRVCIVQSHEKDLL